MRARVDIEVWGELAERAAAELVKGTQVQARTYEDKLQGWGKTDP